MTPEETHLVTDLFDRLARLEGAPRDAEAERLIAQGLQGAPHAVYALVQTALVQDEALKRANARIEDLEAQLSEPPEPEQSRGGFLDNMREALGGRAPRGSVPSVRSGLPGYQSQGFQPQSQPGYPPEPPPPPYPAGPAFGGGGSFIGTAASTAAGMIGGALLLDGIRSVFGHRSGASEHSASGGFSGKRASPWRSDTTSADHTRDASADRVAEKGGDNRDRSSEADTADDYEGADEEEVAEEEEFDGDDWDSPDDTYDA